MKLIKATILFGILDVFLIIAVLLVKQDVRVIATNPLRIVIKLNLNKIANPNVNKKSRKICLCSPYRKINVFR